jgi:NAD(P)-dependent dehydrogenase (short-subunit alcohol dehydrogenase family)
MSLAGARIVVTGARGGFGAPTCRALAERGARVVGLDLHDGEVECGEGTGVRGRVPPVPVLACDVRDAASVTTAVTLAMNQLGGLDALVNNAGVAEVQDAGQMPDDGALRNLDVNLLGSWRVTAACLPFLLAEADRRRGRVITVASVVSWLNIPFAAAYCASKRGVTAWSDVLRLEYGAVLDVTTVHPGYVETPLHGASNRAGLTLGDLMPAESVQDVVGTLVRACEGRPRRRMATTWWGGLGLVAVRHAPALTERLVRARITRAAGEGRFAGSPLARGFVQRVTGRPSVQMPSSSCASASSASARADSAGSAGSSPGS